MMVTPDYSDIEDFPDGRTASEYERDYSRFLEAARCEETPLEDELSTAPVIREWHLRRLHDPETEQALGYPLFQIWGFFENHPFLPPDEIAYSSPVLQIDPTGKWARCASRIYRLKHPKKVN